MFSWQFCLSKKTSVLSFLLQVYDFQKQVFLIYVQGCTVCFFIYTLNRHIWLLLNGLTSVGNASTDENKKNIDR